MPSSNRVYLTVGALTATALAVTAVAASAPVASARSAHTVIGGDARPAGGATTASSALDRALNGVGAASSDDAWAVGIADVSTQPRNLIVHWDGGAWTEVASPNPGTSTNGLSDVSVVSIDDAWAVGSASNTEDHHGLTVALHWNGTRWAQIASESPAAAANGFSDVAAIGASDVWAVGLSTQEFEGSFDGLIEHWDGESWDVVPFADLPGPGDFTGVSGTAADDVWAVGQAAVRGRNVAFIEHYDGEAWSRVALLR